MMTDPLIQAIQETLQITLPSFYIDFLDRHALDTTRNFNDITCLLGTADIAGLNKAYGVQQWMPGYIMIGNDSGDNGILIQEAEANDPQIYLVGLGALSADDAAVLAASLSSWEQRGYPSEDDDVIALSPYTQRRDAAMEIYKSTPDYAWHQQNGKLQIALKEIERAKANKTVDLKTYLSRKKEIQADISSHEAINNNFLPFNKWWKE